MPLQASPANPYHTELAIDCELIPFAGLEQPDAGAANGYVLDYATDPTTLILVGSACDTLQMPGHHTLDLIVGCTLLN